MAKYLTTDQVRTLWLRFFRLHHHYVLPPASLIPIQDDSLLFINSGIATLKPYFTGQLPPPAPNLSNCQPVVRTNDIDLIGRSRSHNTWFEMLGSFSIGGYFKKTVIKYAWEFLTDRKWLGLDPNRLYVTILKADDITYQAWTNLTQLPVDHIIMMQRKTNFWQIGIGPCGPCTEVFYDLGPRYDPENKGIKLLNENQDNDRFLEIWNIVFSEFYYNGTTFTRLDSSKIDTGAGLERLVCAVQQKSTSYETDGLSSLITAIESLSKTKKYKFNLLPAEDHSYPSNACFRSVADHIRAIVMMIKDGVKPSNKERGYVVRRLIRRSIIQGHELQLRPPFLFLLVDQVVKIMGNFYPQLLSQQHHIKQIVRQEEEHFWFLLIKGRTLINHLISQDQVITVQQLFNLYESHGLPREWLKQMMIKHQINLDWSKFDRMVRQHQLTSQQAQKFTTGFSADKFLILKPLNLKPTTCYEIKLECQTQVKAIISDSTLASKLTNNSGFLVLATTPFFAEQCGQQADRGLIYNDFFQAQVIDVQKGPNNIFIHQVQVKGTVQIDDQVTAVVSSKSRMMSARHHTATHLLHAATRAILKSDVHQIGSFNSPKGLRLDLYPASKLTLVQIQKIQNWVQFAIKAQAHCQVIRTSYRQAINKYHAWSLISDYMDDKIVRIVKFGNYSTELCGGTHCSNTSEVEDFIITKVGSKGRNQTRIYALAGHLLVQQFLKQQYKTWTQTILQLLTKTPVKLLNQLIRNQIQQIRSCSITSYNFWVMQDLFLTLNNKLKNLLQRFIRSHNQQKILQIIPKPEVVQGQPLVFKVWSDKIDFLAQLHQFQKENPNYLYCLLFNSKLAHYQFWLGCLRPTLNVRQVFNLWSKCSSYPLKGGGTVNLIRGSVSKVRSLKHLKQELRSCLIQIIDEKINE